MSSSGIWMHVCIQQTFSDAPNHCLQPFPKTVAKLWSILILKRSEKIILALFYRLVITLLLCAFICCPILFRTSVHAAQCSTTTVKSKITIINLTVLAILISYLSCSELSYIKCIYKLLRVISNFHYHTMYSVTFFRRNFWFLFVPLTETTNMYWYI